MIFGVIFLQTVSGGGGGGGGGGTLIFSYIHRRDNFFGFKILKFSFFRVFRKIKLIFFGYEDFVDIFFFLGGGGGGSSHY